jgi:hypothetical protein
MIICQEKYEIMLRRRGKMGEENLSESQIFSFDPKAIIAYNVQSLNQASALLRDFSIQLLLDEI